MLVVAASSVTFAEVPASSFATIPPPPGVPAIPAPPGTSTPVVAAASAPAAPTSATAPALGQVPAIPIPGAAQPSSPAATPASADATKASTAPAMPTAVAAPAPAAPAIPQAPALPLPGGGDKVANPNPPALPIPASTPTATAAVVPPPPPLAIGGLPLLSPPSAAASPADIKPDDAPKSLSFNEKLKTAPGGIVLPPPVKLPPVHPNANRKQTWKTKLKPVLEPRAITFNYKQQLLPPPLSQAAYDRDNLHLPPALYAQDIDQLLLESAAVNDINGVRAALDAGRSANVVNAMGDPALVVAIEAGAREAAQLLIARGADPYVRGPSGKNGYEAAIMTGQPWLLPQPYAYRY